MIRGNVSGRACAIVLMADERGVCTIEDALRAGVTSYVIGGIDRRQIEADPRYRASRASTRRSLLHAELNSAKAALDERKIVERAKGVLMKERRIGEDEAYRALRRLAMDRNKRIVDIAEAILTYAQYLAEPVTARCREMSQRAARAAADSGIRSAENRPEMACRRTSRGAGTAVALYQPGVPAACVGPPARSPNAGVWRSRLANSMGWSGQWRPDRKDNGVHGRG